MAACDLGIETMQWLGVSSLRDRRPWWEIAFWRKIQGTILDAYIFLTKTFTIL
jgi:hypothetical protein